MATTEIYTATRHMSIDSETEETVFNDSIVKELDRIALKFPNIVQNMPSERHLLMYILKGSDITIQYTADVNKARNTQEEKLRVNKSSVDFRCRNFVSANPKELNELITKYGFKLVEKSDDAPTATL